MIHSHALKQEYSSNESYHRLKSNKIHDGRIQGSIHSRMPTLTMYPEATHK